VLTYVPTSDCGEVAVRFFGVRARRIKEVHLGVDLEVFRPVAGREDEQDRDALRRQLGFSADEIVCVYSGKFAPYKNAALISAATAVLRGEGLRYRALFIGAGPTSEELKRDPSAVVLGMMDYRELGRYYRAADIAVWPVGESTSMLDAAACGLPVVVSDKIYREHIDGNGAVYETNNLDALVKTLRVFRDPAVRRRLGDVGVRKMREKFDWGKIALGRLRDFEDAL
jgi:glycosyltransferase involved in cell wall biosynthesis